MPSSVCVGVLAFLQQDDAFDDVAVVDEFAVSMLPGLIRSRCAWLAGLADLAEADLGPLDDGGDVADAEGGAVRGLEDGLRDVVDVAEEADLADVDLLLALLDEAAAGVDVVGGELLLDLRDGEAVGDELFGVDGDLVLARAPPKLETSTTPGTLRNCFSSVQSWRLLSSMVS